MNTCGFPRRPVPLLRVVFAAILVVMLAVTITASLDYSILEVPARLGGDAWFHATLADAYCGFLTFYCWLAYRERTCAARLLWLIAILALGNIAMAAYVLALLWRLPASASAADILLRWEEACDGR